RCRPGRRRRRFGRARRACRGVPSLPVPPAAPPPEVEAFPYALPPLPSPSAAGASLPWPPAAELARNRQELTVNEPRLKTPPPIPAPPPPPPVPSPPWAEPPERVRFSRVRDAPSAT